MGNYLEYFKEGFNLAKKNLYLYTISLAFTIFESFLVVSPINILLKLVFSLIVISIWITYTVSTPKFLDSSPITFKFMVDTIKTNFPRFVGWIIILSLTILILIFPFLKEFPTSGHLIRIIFFVFIYPLFSYFGTMFFAINNEGVLESISKSIKFSIKNINFVYTITPWLILTNFLLIIFPKVLQGDGIINIIYLTITQFVNFIIICSFYLFWKKNYEK